MKQRKSSAKIHGYLSFTLVQFYVIICHGQFHGGNSVAIPGLTDPPEFEGPVSNVTVALGREATLQCVVNNLGSYKVAWIHLGRQMILTIDKHVISRVPRFSVTHDNHKTWLLNVANAQADDRGLYMCQVNTNPMISQVGYLQVVVPPDIVDEESTPSSVGVRENHNLTLTCKATGFPEPKITWKREHGNGIVLDRKKKVTTAMHHGRNLTITKISRMDMGAYLCIASNGVPPSVSKRITVDVDFMPVISVSNQLVGAPVGTDVTIDCLVEAYPRAINYWIFGDGILASANKRGNETSENSYRTHMKLTVKDLQRSDFGTYKCISKNPLGETEGTIRLYEIIMPSASPREREAMTSRADEGHENANDGSSVVKPTKSDERKSEELLRKQSRSPPSGKKYFNNGAGCSTMSSWSDRILWLVMTTLINGFILECANSR